MGYWIKSRNHGNFIRLEAVFLVFSKLPLDFKFIIVVTKLCPDVSFQDDLYIQVNCSSVVRLEGSTNVHVEFCNTADVNTVDGRFSC